MNSGEEQDRHIHGGVYRVAPQLKIKVVVVGWVVVCKVIYMSNPNFVDLLVDLGFKL